MEITNTQLTELRRKRVNVYTNIAGTAALLGGYTSEDDHWLDAVWWLMWARSEIETAVWDTMRGSRRYTNASLQNNLTAVCEQGVLNGGIQPGRTVSTATRADIIRVTGNRPFRRGAHNRIPRLGRSRSLRPG